MFGTFEGRLKEMEIVGYEGGLLHWGENLRFGIFEGLVEGGVWGK